MGGCYEKTLAIFASFYGCDSKFISFSGKSDNWKGEYTAYISDNGTREEGKYVFGCKHATRDQSFDFIEVEINDGETDLREENVKGPTIAMSTSCSVCSVTREDTAIKVTIRWDDKKESFELKPN